ncbi:POU domain, class 6, transcription factor 1-like isoform X2 [Lineus longissimus]
MMDSENGDTNSVAEINGETKPDAAKLAQTAIIKQDVMLSGSSHQSPATSSFSLPAMSMPLPTVAMPSTIGAALTPGLADQLFMSVASAGDSMMTQTMTEQKPDLNVLNTKLISNQLGQHAISSSQTQLLGQPQVAPQFIVAGQGGQMQQSFLIPVSTGNGTQQLISIPVSLAAGSGQQIHLLTTANGQIIATNLGNMPGIQTLGGGISNNVVATAPPTPAPAPATTQMASIPQILTNAQGQIIALGTPQVLPQQVAVSQSSGTILHSAAMNTAQMAPQTLTAQSQVASLPQTLISQAAVTPAVHSMPSQPTTIQVTTPQLTTPVSTPVTNHLPPNVSQLLPNTVSQSSESTTVDGINLDEIKEFAKQFKIRRLSLGLTQTQVGQALSATEGPAYSQSAICRFEKLDITPKSAQKIKPVLEKWMREAEERYKNGVQNLTEFIGSEPSKKRKRRTSFTPQALEVLNEHFERNTHPSGAEMTDLSGKLRYDREVIRVWFCNKRQGLKNTIKKFKAPEQPYAVIKVDDSILESHVPDGEM